MQIQACHDRCVATLSIRSDTDKILAVSCPDKVTVSGLELAKNFKVPESRIWVPVS